MLKNINAKTFLLSTIMLVFLLFVSTTGFAWLKQYDSSVEVTNVGGQLLTNYFHRGEGTEENPFVITRPIHYYNLVHLYQKISDYSEHPYYFQIGYELEGVGTGYKVYNYDDLGRAISNDPYSTTLNLTYYSNQNALLPIGTHDKNFIGVFNGKGITVRGCTISTLAEEKDCDIGIFGYVGGNAIIKDLYFEDITIDLQNISSETSVITSLSPRQTHNADIHIANDTNIAYAGYLAGHIKTNSQFINVYINNVSIVGGGAGTASTNNFSYFGCIEDIEGNAVDTLGETFAQGFSSSINIDEIYGRLLTYRTNSVERELVTSKSVWVENGSREDFNVVSSSVVRENDTASPSGSFSFSKEEASSEGNTIYLTGQREFSQEITTISLIENNGEGYLLKNANSSVFLKMNENNTGYETTTNIQNATVWATDGNGRIFTTKVQKYHECVYYYISKTGITTNEAEAVQWTYDESAHQLYYIENGTTNYLGFIGNELSTGGGTGGGDIDMSIISDGTNYLVLDLTKENNLGNTTNKDNASRFAQDGTGGWYTTVSNDGQGTKYYLYKNTASTILSLVTNPQVTYVWTIADGKWTFEDTQITFSGTKWTLIKTSNNANYIYRNNATAGYPFLSIDKSSINGTSANTIVLNGTKVNNVLQVPTDATLWLFTKNENDVIIEGPVYTIINGVYWYLKGDISSDYNTLTLTSDANLASNWRKSGGYLSYLGTSTVGVKYDATYGFYLPRSGSSGTSFSMSMSGVLVAEGTGGHEQLVSTPCEMFKETGKDYNTTTTVISSGTVNYPIDTWFPISAGENGTPLNSNNGYIVSGMTFKNDNLYQSGDIRFTQSPISSISNSYNGGALTNIYTVNNSGVVNAENVLSFTGLNATKENYLQTIKNKSTINSIKFMGSVVSADDTTTASSITINNETYSNYALPRHCIDLHTKENGILSILAGSLSNSTNNFFSLYHIERNANQEILSIKKISKIYSALNESTPYVYAYQNESDSYFGTYELLFDCSWCASRALTSNSLYYFEIPVNMGEYAIGAEDGNDGANLLYLENSQAITQVASTGLTDCGFKVDFRSNGYINSSNYTPKSLIQFAFDVPNASKDDFSVTVNFTTENLQSEFSKGLYIINVTNKTSSPCNLTVILCDDDEIAGNEYLYAYKIVYTNDTETNQTLKNGAKDYFNFCANLVIP